MPGRCPGSPLALIAVYMSPAPPADMAQVHLVMVLSSQEALDRLKASETDFEAEDDGADDGVRGVAAPVLRASGVLGLVLHVLRCKDLLVRAGKGF